MVFRCKSCYVVAGSAEFPTGDTDALRRSRSETLLTKIAQTLISCDCGWQLDTSKNATDTSYVDIPCATGSKTYPGLFFINTISGCKLFMSYFGDYIQNYGIKDFSGGDLVLFNNNKYHGGVCTSIIPEGSSSTFGDPTTSTFIPSDATRICGTFYRTNFIFSSIKYAAACNPINNYYYKYWVFATPYTIGFYVNRKDGEQPDIATIIYTTGKLFSTVSHVESHRNAKYGTYMFRDQSGDDEGWATVLTSQITVLSETIQIPARSDNQSNPYTVHPSASVSRADGTWILGGNGSNYNTIARVEDVVHLSSKVFTASSSTTRWIPFSVVYIATNLTTGIVSGDGFKGILDTELFRCGISSKGDTFDGGKFVCLESTKNILTGIDPQDQPV